MDCESQKQPPTKMLRPGTVLYSERQSNFIPSMGILHIKGLDSIKSHKNSWWRGYDHPPYTGSIAYLI